MSWCCWVISRGVLARGPGMNFREAQCPLVVRCPSSRLACYFRSSCIYLQAIVYTLVFPVVVVVVVFFPVRSLVVSR